MCGEVLLHVLCLVYNGGNRMYFGNSYVASASLCEQLHTHFAPTNLVHKYRIMTNPVFHEPQMSTTTNVAHSVTIKLVFHVHTDLVSLPINSHKLEIFLWYSQIPIHWFW